MSCDASIVVSLAPWAIALAVSLVVALVYLGVVAHAWWRVRRQIPEARVVRRHRGRR